ncbi:vitamin K epoxide reductase family protein [Scytonema sp. UIC 10036]|uniref:vitamin K epoxide reductase family protein n=1 Tax=Scytonema sp. UIC 10036 TaxID=2304196 RepID=UPI001FAAD9AC|nr:vitamin K epoxide reductase family protein [Scytonema sp. UIC 10036]
MKKFLVYYFLDTVVSAELAREEWAENKAFCEYCQVATVCSIASLVLAAPEVLAATRVLLSRRDSKKAEAQSNT